MSDIQKAIDEFTESMESHIKGDGYHKSVVMSGFSSELKSLLEQVAKEAFYAGELHEIWTEYPGFEDWWDEQNLTFNED